MAKTRIVFGPADSAPGASQDGITLRFRFGVVRHGEGARRDEVSGGSVLVNASRSLLAAWGINDRPVRDPVVVGTMFQYALDEVQESIAQGLFPATTPVTLEADSQPRSSPFDVSKLVAPNGHVLEVDEDELRQASLKTGRVRQRIGLTPRSQEKVQDADA